MNDEKLKFWKDTVDNHGFVALTDEAASAIIDAALEARADRDAAERTAAVAISAAITARALAFEELKRALNPGVKLNDYSRDFTAKQLAHIADVIAALAPLDPSLVAVPVETLEKVKGELISAQCHLAGDHDRTPVDGIDPASHRLDAALALLAQAVKP
jgi:hypothetical protein